MRILLLSLNFAPELTATGKYTGEMAIWFASRGHSVEVIAGLPHYPEWRVREDYRRSGFTRENLQGVMVMRTPHTVPDPGRVSAAGRIVMESGFSLATLFWWFRILFRRRRYDVVIAVCPPMQDGIMPWLYGLIRRVPWVFHIQDFQVDAAVSLGMIRGGFFGRTLYGVENFLLRRASRVSSITPAMCNRAIDKGVARARTWLVPNWADLTAIFPTPRENGLRRKLDVGPQQLLVLYAGGMGVKQGLEVVVHAAKLLSNDESIRFAMVGAGPARPQLEAAVAEAGLRNVCFLPVQPAGRLNELLAAADIHLVVQRGGAADLVMPSKVANIFAAGRPTVATAASGTFLYEILVENDCGVSVEPENAEAFAQAILKLSTDSSTRQRMGANARTYAEKNLSRDVIMGGFERDLMSLVGRQEVQSAKAT